MKNVLKDVKKIAKLVDDIKRGKKVAKTLKSLDAGMLDVAAPILNLPRSNVFRETMIRGSFPKFDNMKDVLSAKVKEAQRSAIRKQRAKTGHDCVVAKLRFALRRDYAVHGSSDLSLYNIDAMDQSD